MSGNLLPAAEAKLPGGQLGGAISRGTSTNSSMISPGHSQVSMLEVLLLGKPRYVCWYKSWGARRIDSSTPGSRTDTTMNTKVRQHQAWPPVVKPYHLSQKPKHLSFQQTLPGFASVFFNTRRRTGWFLVEIPPTNQTEKSCACPSAEPYFY